MRKEILLPALALAGGGAGFLLRRTELDAAYDPVSRLMSMDHPATWILMGLAAVMLAVFVLACRGAEKRNNTPRQWFCAPEDPVYIMLTVSASLILLIAAGFAARELLHARERTVMKIVSVALSVLGALGALAAGRCSYRNEWSEYVPLQLMGPAFCALVWLIVGYQAHAREPEIQLFAWQILAGVSVVMALYNQVSLSLNKCRLWSVCVPGLMGIFLSLVTLADSGSLTMKTVNLFSALYLTAQMYLLLRNAFGAPWPERMPRRAEEDDEEDDEENGIQPLFGPKE